MKIIVTSQYGVLSQGRHSARKGNGKTDIVWSGKDEKGNLVITEPGIWNLHCADGFKRVARAVLKVSEDGSWAMSGDTKRFDVIED